MFNRNHKVKNGAPCESGYMRLRVDESGKEYTTVEVKLSKLVQTLGDKVKELNTSGNRRFWRFRI